MPQPPEDLEAEGLAPVIDPRELPPVRVDRESLQAAVRVVCADPLFNPHHEPEVPDAQRQRLVDAAVMIPFDLTRDEVLLTRRASRLRFGGHIVFPGGKRDPSDRDAVATAVRETEEEIGLSPADVEVLGSLGDYCTHSGYRMTGVVGAVAAHAELKPDAREVAEVIPVPIAELFNAASWTLRSRSHQPWRANFVLTHGAATVSGPTVSLLLHLWRALANR